MGLFINTHFLREYSNSTTYTLPKFFDLYG